MKAGIIAAGWGQRLAQNIPKALTPIGRRALIDYALDGLQAAGASEVTCIVNEAARSVPDYVAKASRRIKMDWVIQTTPSSMHSFLIVLEHLANQPSPPTLSRVHAGEGEVRRAAGEGSEAFLITTVDSVGPLSIYKDFVESCQHFPDADLCLGLTPHTDDEKPLRVAMRGKEGTGLLPERVAQDPPAFEITAMSSNGFESEFVTAGLYWAHPRILQEKEKVLSGGLSALRQYFGYLLKYGYRFYGVPLPPVLDVDRPQDIAKAAEWERSGLVAQATGSAQAPPAERREG